MAQHRSRSTRGVVLPPPRDPGRVFDYFHVNSIEIDHDGNLLVSARNTQHDLQDQPSNRKDLWRLGGKRSDFTLGLNVRFAWQHDARRRPDGALTLFDNSAGPQVRKQSRGLILRLDIEADACHRHPELRASAADRRGRPGKPAAASRRQLLHRVGHQPAIHGVRAARDDPLRRSLRTRARGIPTAHIGFPDRTARRQALALAVRNRSVYVSWNGATEVVSWQLLQGPSKTELRPVRVVPKTGFETRIPLGTDNAGWIAVRGSTCASEL